jgi:hypothetical protein
MAACLKRLPATLLATLLLALACGSNVAADSGRKLMAPATTTTTIKYSSDAARMAAIWIDPTHFTLLGGDKAPKFTGSKVSSGIIQWSKTDTHSMAEPMMRKETAVLTTGDAKWAISKAKYKGEKAPKYPDITNKHIKACGAVATTVVYQTQLTPQHWMHAVYSTTKPT